MTAAGVLTAAMVAPALGGGLSIEQVAPSDPVGVLSISGLEAVVSRLSESGLLDSTDREDLNEEVRGVFGSSPEGIAEVWRTMLEDRDLLEVLSAISAGLVLWVEPEEDSKGVLTVAVWVDLGSEQETIATAWDAGWETYRAEPHVKTESVLGRDVDHVQSRRADSNAEPSRRSPMPSDTWVVREEGLILFSNTRAGLTRLLDAVDGEDFDDTLADTEQWASVKGMLDGSDALLAAVFVDEAFTAGGLFDQMGIAAMLRGSFDAAIGPVKAIAVSGGPGTGDTLLSWSAAIWMPDGPGGLLRLVAHDTPRAALPGWVGPDTIAVTRLNVDFKRIPDWIRTVIASNPMLMGVGQMLDQSEPTLRAILEPLGRRFLSIETVTRPLTAESLNSVSAIACTNPTALSDALGASVAEAGMEPRDFQGHQIWSAELGDLGPIPMPGLEGTISLAVAGGQLFAGDETAVEAALRGLADRSGVMPAWLDRVSGWLPNQPFAGWGGWDLAESLTAVADVQRLQITRWEDEIKVDDPELWEEIKGELVDEDQAEQYERLARIARHLGPAAWWAGSGDDGFRIRGVVMGRGSAAGESVVGSR